MKVTTKKLESTKLELNIEVGQEIVKKKFDDVYAHIRKDAKIPGFRPGMAPRDILEKHHGRLAQEEVIKDLVSSAYRDSIKKENINAIELPQISDVKLESNILSFKAVVQTMPEIEVKDYKNLKLKYKKVLVTREELDKTIEQLKEAHKTSLIDDKFAKGFGYKDVEAMRSSLERQMLVQKESDQRYHMQEDLVRQIMDKITFNVPQSLVDRRLEELVYDAQMHMLKAGANKEQIKSKEEDLKKELLKDAQNQVKSFLILQEIAKRENIPQDEHMSAKVIEMLLKEANWVIEE